MWTLGDVAVGLFAGKKAVKRRQRDRRHRALFPPLERRTEAQEYRYELMQARKIRDPEERRERIAQIHDVAREYRRQVREQERLARAEQRQRQREERDTDARRRREEAAALRHNRRENRHARPGGPFGLFGEISRRPDDREPRSARRSTRPRYERLGLSKDDRIRELHGKSSAGGGPGLSDSEQHELAALINPTRVDLPVALLSNAEHGRGHNDRRSSSMAEARRESEKFHGTPDLALRVDRHPAVEVGELESITYRAPAGSRRAGRWEHKAGDTLLGRRHGGQSLVVADLTTGDIELVGERFKPDRGIEAFDEAVVRPRLARRGEGHMKRNPADETGMRWALGAAGVAGLLLFLGGRRRNAS